MFKKTRVTMIASILCLLILAGCGSDDPASPPSPSGGTIVVNVMSEAIDAPWVISGFASGDSTGIGDLTMTEVPPGDYTLTWGPVADWVKPSASTLSLETGGTVTFTGSYVSFESILADFTSTALAQWVGIDYTTDGTGEAGIDGVNSVVQTLAVMGCAVPATVADGLVGNFFGEEPSQEAFSYVVPTGATDDDVTNGIYTDLEPGDLICLDFDMDSIYDHIAIYLGAYQQYTHAALNASDYYDEVVVEDLDDHGSILFLDIHFSNTTTRRLDGESLFGVGQ